MHKQEELTAFWKAENRLYNETNQLYHRLARHNGLSDCAFWLLYTLRDEGGPMTQAQLSALLCLPKQTVNSALKQMTEAGCLRLEAVDGNLKNKRVCLTELGEARLGPAIDDVFRLEERAAARLTAEERSALLSLEEKLLDAFRAEAEQAIARSAGFQEDVCHTSGSQTTLPTDGCCGTRCHPSS